MPLPISVTQARIVRETTTEFSIASASTKWFLLAILGFVGASAVSLLAILAGVSGGVLIALAICAVLGSLGLLLAFFAPYQITIAFDTTLQTVTLSKAYLIGGMFRPPDKQWALRDVGRMIYQTFFRTNNLEISMSDGQKILLVFGANRADAEKSAQQIAARLGLPAEAAVPQKIGEVPASPSDAVSMMQREIRTWGFWSLALGAIHFLAPNTFSAPWGAALIAVGIASFFFRDAAMFVIYGSTMAWVAVSNLLFSGLGTWTLIGLLQFYWSFRLFQHFRAFKKAQATVSASMAAQPTEIGRSRAEKFFPWGGCLLGISAVIAFGSVILGAFVLALGGVEAQSILVFIEGLSISTAILGIATSLASLLSGFEYKAVSVIGLATGLFVILAELAFVILS